MTVTNLILRIRDLLNEDTAGFWTDAELTRYMNDAERDIAIKALCLQQIDSLTTVNATQTVSSLAYKTMFLEYLQSTTKGIGMENILSSQWGHTPGLGVEPQIWFERGTLLYIEPIPNAIYNLKTYTADYPTSEVSTGGNSPEIPEAFVPLIILYVVSVCLMKDRRYVAGQQVYAMYMNELLYNRSNLIEIVPDVKAATNYHEFNKVT